MTFRACPSPAPTPVKPQPAPAILSQESVHTTLSITHHTRKRPSTGPRTTHGPHSTADENNGFPAFSARLRNLLLAEKFKPLGSPSTMRSKIQSNGSDARISTSKMLVATMTRSASTSLSVWTKLHLHGSSHSRSTQSTSGTSSRNSSPATSWAPWGARVLAWT
jgi:hypothetical protein